MLFDLAVVELPGELQLIGNDVRDLDVVFASHYGIYSGASCVADKQHIDVYTARQVPNSANLDNVCSPVDLHATD